MKIPCLAELRSRTKIKKFLLNPHPDRPFPLQISSNPTKPHQTSRSGAMAHNPHFRGEVVVPVFIKEQSASVKIWFPGLLRSNISGTETSKGFHWGCNGNPFPGLSPLFSSALLLLLQIPELATSLTHGLCLVSV